MQYQNSETPPLKLGKLKLKHTKQKSERISSMRTMVEPEKTPNLIIAFTERHSHKNVLKEDPPERSYDIFKTRKRSDPGLGPYLPELITTSRNFERSLRTPSGKLGSTQVNFGIKHASRIKPKQFDFTNTETSRFGSTSHGQFLDTLVGSRQSLLTNPGLAEISEKIEDFGNIGQKKRSLHEAIDQFIARRERRHFSIAEVTATSVNDAASHNVSNYASNKLPIPQSIEEVELRVIMGSEESKKHLLDLSILNQMKKLESSYLERNNRAYTNLVDMKLRKEELISRLTKIAKKQANERRDAQSLIGWFNSLATVGDCSNLEDLHGWLCSQSALCTFAFGELWAYLSTTCKDYAVYLRLVQSHWVSMVNRLLTYVGEILQNADQQRVSDFKQMSDHFKIKEQRLQDDIEQMRELIDQKDEKIEDQRRLIASMRSKLYSDYVVIRGLKREVEFSESKLDVVQEENKKISKIVSELGEAAVIFELSRMIPI